MERLSNCDERLDWKRRLSQRNMIASPRRSTGKARGSDGSLPDLVQLTRVRSEIAFHQQLAFFLKLILHCLEDVAHRYDALSTRFLRGKVGGVEGCVANFASGHFELLREHGKVDVLMDGRLLRKVLPPYLFPQTLV